MLLPASGHGMCVNKNSTPSVCTPRQRAMEVLVQDCSRVHQVEFGHFDGETVTQTRLAFFGDVGLTAS